MMEPAGSRGRYSLDLPEALTRGGSPDWPAKAWQSDVKVSGEAWRPGLPAERRGEGGRWGRGGARDCADTGRKLASKFYQLSVEEVGAGPGAEDGCGGRDLDLHGNEPCGPQGRPCPPTPRPQHSHIIHPSASGPTAFGANWGSGWAQLGSRSRNQGQDWETQSPLSLPHTTQTRRPHVILPSSLGIGTVVTPTVQRRKLTHRTRMCPQSHSQ